MYFEHLQVVHINKYGVGTTAAKGRYHLLASLEGTEEVKMLCLSSPARVSNASKKPVQWFEDEIRAAKVLRAHKKACQKCLRSIETTEETTKETAEKTVEEAADRAVDKGGRNSRQ